MLKFSKATITQFPTGSWGFVGLVHVDLQFDEPDKELLQKSLDAGCTQFLKRRVFKTQHDALSAYREVMGKDYE